MLWAITRGHPLNLATKGNTIYIKSTTCFGVMEKQGLVKRTKDLDMKNMVRITLTDKSHGHIIGTSSND